MNGQITINNVSDQQFIRLVEIKDKSNGKLHFGQNSSIGQTIQVPVAGGTYKTEITNILLFFDDAIGAKSLADVLQMLATPVLATSA